MVAIFGQLLGAETAAFCNYFHYSENRWSMKYAAADFTWRHNKVQNQKTIDRKVMAL